MNYLETLSVAQREAFDQANKNLIEMTARNGLREVSSVAELRLNAGQVAHLERSGLTVDTTLKYFVSENGNVGLIVGTEETGRYHFELFYKSGFLGHNDRAGWIIEDLEDAIKNI